MTHGPTRLIVLLLFVFAGCSDSSSTTRVEEGDANEDHPTCAAASIDECETLENCTVSVVEPLDPTIDRLKECVSREHCRDVSEGEYVAVDGGAVCARVLSNCVDPDFPLAPECHSTTDCGRLDASECEENEDCVPVLGDRMTADSCYVEDFGMCMSKDIGCNNIVVHAEATDGTCWRFLSQCTPKFVPNDLNGFMTSEDCMDAFEAAVACE